MKTYPVLPTPGAAQLRVFNGVPNCEYTIQTNVAYLPEITLKGIDYWLDKDVKIDNKKLTIKYTIKEAEGCPKFPGGTYTFAEETAYGIFLQNNIPNKSMLVYIDGVEKSRHANPLVRNLANIDNNRRIIWRASKSGDIEWNTKANNRTLIELRPTAYDVLIDNVKVYEAILRHGGVYSLIIGSDDNDQITAKIFEVTAPNSMSILLLIPQYLVMTLGEVMFSVTGLEFSYSQAPVTMKSVLQACWLLAVAFGNIIVVVVAELKFFKSQASEFFLFAGLMFVDMIVFMWVAYCYKPNNPVSLTTQTTAPIVQTERPESSSFPKHQQQQRAPRYTNKQMD